ncbi:MAG: cardiolipin synthase [Oscillospiraceae bacterium]|nr:cardiolipin synthase [Oscillospiraceae bacterium]
MRWKIRQRRERRIEAALHLLVALTAFVLQLLILLFLRDFLRENAAFAYILMQVMGFCCAVHVANRREPTEYKVSWILLLILAPVTGVLLFLLWGGARQSKHLSLKKKLPPGESESARMKSEHNAEKLTRAYPQWGRLAAYLQRNGFSVYDQTKAAYFPDGRGMFKKLLCDMEEAHRFIFLEYFILAEGELWERMFAILKEKAREGVEVKIIFDDFGNLTRFSAQTIEAIREAGIELRIFNPVHKYVNRLYFNYRDHRKIACVDGDISYTGGLNIADEYADIVRRFGYWKDSAVRLEGEGAWGLTAQFIHMWEMLGGTLASEHDYYRSHTNVRADGFCQPFCDGPDNNPQNPAEATFLQLITSARRFLYITTPYLAISDAMLSALCIAAEGGVDVRLMMPGQPDKKYAYMVAETYFGELLSHGVKIYRYEPGFLHAKSVMVDREAAFVGTVNMDYRSFHLHYECGVMLYGAPAVEELVEDMDAIAAHSVQITMEEWRQRGLFRRALASLLRLVAIWM